MMTMKTTAIFYLDPLSTENPMDRGVWQATVRGVTKGQRQLINTHFSVFHIYEIIF